jgi:hypothetical protein
LLGSQVGDARKGARTMVQAVEVKVALVRAQWQTPRPDATNLTPWSHAVLEQIFEVRNGWSLGSYWDACSLGLRRLKFKFYDLQVLEGEQRGNDQDRDDVIKSALRQCNAKNIFTEPYDHFIILVSPAGNDSGARGQNLLFDQNGEHEFFAHELGHLLGLEHPFGWDGARQAIEYNDEYCLMGYTGYHHSEMNLPSDPAIVSSFPPPPTKEGDPHYFWRSGRMPSAATLFQYWRDFRTTPGFVYTATRAQVGQTVTLTALSEVSEGGPVLLLIEGPSGANHFVEYRLNTNWDKGFTRQQNVPYSIVVIHSYHVFTNYLNYWSLPGGDRVWFNYAIEPPFHDAWIGSTGIGVEIVGQSPDKKKVTLRIVDGSSRKTAELVERRGRARFGEKISQSGTVFLDKSSDGNLCSNTPKQYSVEVATFGEQVTVDLMLSGFADPVIDEWTLNEQVLPGTSGHATPPVEAERNVILNSPVGQGQRISLGKDHNSTNARIDYATGLNGVILTTSSGVGSYELRIACTVRDRAMGATEPGAIRIATLAIHVDGDRVIYDQSYRDDAERCWWVRRQVPQPVRDWPPGRNELRFPWVDPLDKHAISDLMQRLRLQGIDLKPRREG